MKHGKKILIYKIVCFAFAFLLLLIPARHFSHTEIRILAIVLGIDGNAGDVTVSAQLAVPVAQNGDGKASTVAKANGGSLGEALENLQIGLGRRIDYGHLSTVVIGKDTKLPDLKDFISHLLSSDTVGPGAYLAYSDATPAYEFIAEAQNLGESSDAELGNFITFSRSDNHVTTTTALKFLQTLHSSSGAAFMPCVKVSSGDDGGGVGKGRGGSGSEDTALKQQNDTNDITPEQEKELQEQKEEKQQSSDEQSGGDGKKNEQGEESGGESGSGGGSGEQMQKAKLVSSESLAVYGGNGEEPMILSSLVTRGVVLIDKYSDYGLFELRNVLIDGQTVASVSALLDGKTVRKSVRRVGEENILTYKVHLKLRLTDSRICDNPHFYDKLKNALVKDFESVIKNNILSAVDYSKQSGVDYLGIRDIFRKFCRKGFENFDLGSVTVNVNAKVTIKE